jgi:plastocyanin domain-containing protein
MEYVVMRALVFVALFAACSKSDDHAGTAATPPSDPTHIEIKVTDNGFEPENVTVPAGKPVTLVFERKVERTCATEFILTMDDGKQIEKQLPLGQRVELVQTFPKPGKLGYACHMDMFRGTITVQ